jgi:hypothetical protein
MLGRRTLAFVLLALLEMTGSKCLAEDRAAPVVLTGGCTPSWVPDYRIFFVPRSQTCQTLDAGEPLPPGGGQLRPSRPRPGTSSARVRGDHKRQREPLRSGT